MNGFTNFISGLRALKIVLRVSANRLLAHPNETEENLVYRSLLDVNTPKINAKDMPLFKSIVNDLFPNSTSDENNYDWLREPFERNCIEKHYQPVETLYKKLIETYEMSKYRQGLMLIGNPYTGKSFTLKTLIDATIIKNNSQNNKMDIGMNQNIQFVHFFHFVYFDIYVLKAIYIKNNS